MRYPDFFDAVPRIRLHDPLADFLGACDGGIIEYAYPDAVRLAGHSCPTVAGAYWLTHQALRALYGEALPERGGVRVAFRESRTAGVTGVIANVVSLLTGATTDTGFKGLAGKLVPVEVFSLQGKKKVAGFQLTGIRLNRRILPE